MLESDELLSLNLLSSETRRLEGSVLSVAGVKNEMKKMICDYLSPLTYPG